jgi:coenzyme F420-0:L-glutamate ligase / coenzyme F420-1:gamma-L-glutamate ligase
MKLELTGIEGLPEFERGDDVARIVAEGVERAGESLRRGDVVVVTQKVVSKAEGRLVRLADVVPSPFAAEWAQTYRCDPRLIELVLRESRRVVRMDRGVLITETHHGLVCANGGVDLSNVAGGEIATLLPKDPDASAQRIREGLMARAGVDLAVIISDTFGRPWREGLTNVAIGVAGLRPLESYAGARDPAGFVLTATVQAIADEVAGASGLVARKLSRIPAVVVRGLVYDAGEGTAGDLIRSPERDLFR